MNKIDAETLFASLFHRWTTGDVSDIESDFAEDVEGVFDDQVLHIEDLKSRTIYFYENFEILETKFEDFIFEGQEMAIRAIVKLKNRKDNEVTENSINWFFEVKNNLVYRYWVITNFSFGFNQPEVKGGS